MKIVIVAPGGFDRSGRERVIPALLWLVERLARRHTVHVCALEDVDAPCSYPLVGATIHALGRVESRVPGVRMLRLRRRLMDALARIGRPDVIHGFWAGTTGLLAGLAGRELGCPVTLSIGGGELVWLPAIGYGGQGTWR